MKSKILYLILLVFLLPLIYFLTSSYIFLPVDILKGLPLFGFTPSGIHNSLLADPVFQFEPWRIFMKEAFVHGHLPFWNDLNGNGVPFLANPITSVFFPLNLLYILFPPKFSLLIMALIKTGIFCFGVYCYLRKVNISKEMALLGSVISTSGYFILWLDWPQTNVYIFFPFVLLFVEKLYEKTSFSNFTVFSLIFFLAFLGGHPETYFQIALVGFLYSMIRYPKGWRCLSYYCFAILIGTLLAGFQLLPFLEYLYHSYALQARSITPHSGLGLETLIFNFFPYILGAPHLKFYKPFPGTNFQEAAGGYVGIIFFILILKRSKFILISPLQRTWLLISVISILLAYSIPVVSDVIKLTPLGINANSRMIAIFGFGVLVMGISILDAIQIKKVIEKIKVKVHVAILSILSLTLLAIHTHFFDFLLTDFGETQSNFVQILTIFIAVCLISTLCFFLTASLKGKLPKYLYLFLLVVFISSQTLFLFVSYNTFAGKEFYYPENKAIEILKKRNVPVLNVGNVNLSPDINMAYGIKSIENYDAMDISWYKKYFDANFPDKNRWENVDSVTLESLKKFGVGSVISDYDINLEKVSVVKESDNVHSLTKKNIVSIIGDGKILKQIRFLPATYNRKNSCNLFITIRKGNDVLQKSKLTCNKLYNGMFYTVTIEPELLIKQTQYQIEFEVEGGGVGLFGDKDSPYLDVLFDSGKNYFDKLYDKDQIVIYEVPDSNVIETTAKIGRVSDESDKLTFVAFSKKQTQVTVKKTYYPGWQLKVNDANVPIEGRNPFMIFKVLEGQSRIELKYVPYSFYLGLIISGLTLFVIISISILLIFRNLRSWKSGTRFYNYIYKKTVKIPASLHIYLFGLSFLISVIGFVFVCAIIPVKFVVPDTTAINWLTVNHYPKQQDLYLFALGFPGIIISSIVIWTILICKKK